MQSETTPSLIKSTIFGGAEEGWLRQASGRFSGGLLALLLSTAIFELTENIVYVMLMEVAFELGGGATSVGIFLIIQSTAQMTLGSLVGSYSDALGSRKAGIFGLVALTSLAAALAFVDSIAGVYLLALLVTVARLFVITSRLPLISELSERSGYVTANTAVWALTGLGLFVGPAVGAALYLIGEDPAFPFVVSAGLFLLAAIPLLFGVPSGTRSGWIRPVEVIEEMRIGWRHIASHSPIREVLICLMISTMAFGAVVPLLTLLSKRIGFGIEGSGMLVAALGLGWMLGPLVAGALVRRVGYSTALLTTGLITPMGVLAIGLIPSVAGILAALSISAFGGAALNVIVISIIQRLTPDNRQGSVIGAQQALSGLVWILSAAAITGVLALAGPNIDLRMLFYPIGALGTLMVLACWFSAKGILKRKLAETGNRVDRASVGWWRTGSYQ